MSSPKPLIEEFAIEIAGAASRGSSQRPAKSDDERGSAAAVGESGGPAVPAILICRGVHVQGEDDAGLCDDLTAALLKRGVAVARFEPRCADLILEDFDAHCAGHDLSDALAVHQWLAARPSIDRQHIGVLGFALGAIPAAALARQTKDIECLCLLAPTTAEHLVTKLVRGNGSPASLDPAKLPKAYLPSLADTDSARDAGTHDRPILIVHGAADR